QLEPVLAVSKSAGDLDPSRWLICELASATLYTQATCGSGARAYLLDGNKLIGKHEGKSGDDRGFRLRRVGGQVLLELSEQGGASSKLFWVEADKFRELAAAGGLMVRPPAGCRMCEDDWSGTMAEGEGVDEGADESADEFEDIGDDMDEEAVDEGMDEEAVDEGADEGEDEERPTAPSQPALPPRSPG
ncbi:MAG: hypothetical protein KC431_12675, partial [Myxococcales bacterium]|nr:hypothetical protein [Myxococcales bacterium]